MLPLIAFILKVLAFVLFLIAGFWNPQPPTRWSLIGIGLACYTLADILVSAGHIQ